MQIIHRIMTNNDCYKQGRKMVVKGLMIHSTGANNPNIARYVDGLEGSSYNHWNKTGITKCVHGFIGKYQGTVQCAQTLPWDMCGWHCGGTGNNNYIGVEICEDDLNDLNYLMDCLGVAAELFATLCIDFGLDPTLENTIISHHKGNTLGIATNHADIDHWLKIHSLMLDDFVNMVIYYYRKLNRENEEVEIVEEQTVSTWAQEAWEWAKEQKLMNGKYPKSPISREETAVVLYRFYQTFIQSRGDI